MVLAHRGASAETPGNTLPAFQLAVAQGADALETDVHWTKDGHIVVAHDAQVDKTSNGKGLIAQLTLKELLELDFGYRFTKDNGQTFPWRNRGVKIVTLDDVLRNFPELKINIDLKPAQPPSFSTLLTLLNCYDALQRVLIASFHHRNLRVIRQMSPKLATSASTQETCQFLLHAGSFRRYARFPFVALQIPVQAGPFTIVSASLVNRAHDCGIHVHAWTINDAYHMMKLLSFGVDGIVTDNPGLADDVRTRWKHQQTQQSG